MSHVAYITALIVAVAVWRVMGDYVSKLALVFSAHHPVPVIKTVLDTIEWLVTARTMTAFVAPTVVPGGLSSSAGA